MTMEFYLVREVVITCFNRRLIIFDLLVWYYGM